MLTVHHSLSRSSNGPSTVRSFSLLLLSLHRLFHTDLTCLSCLSSVNQSEYPSFILVNRAAASNGSSGGPPPSTLDPTLGDARIRIAASKATKDAEKSLRRRIRERSEWRVSQGLPALREGEADPVAGGGEISFWMLGASLYVSHSSTSKSTSRRMSTAVRGDASSLRLSPMCIFRIALVLIMVVMAGGIAWVVFKVRPLLSLSSATDVDRSTNNRLSLLSSPTSRLFVPSRALVRWAG